MSEDHKKLLDLWTEVEAAAKRTDFVHSHSAVEWTRAYMNFEREIRAQLAKRDHV